MAILIAVSSSDIHVLIDEVLALWRWLLWRFVDPVTSLLSRWRLLNILTSSRVRLYSLKPDLLPHRIDPHSTEP
jgi:hypothetical protein